MVKKDELMGAITSGISRSLININVTNKEVENDDVAKSPSKLGHFTKYDSGQKSLNSEDSENDW